MLKTLMVVSSVLFATAAMAQGTQNQAPTNPNMQPQTPGSKQPNAQGEKPAANRTMQEKGSSLTNQEGGAPGVTGSTGTQSGTPPAETKK